MFGFEDFDKLIPAIIAVLWIGAQIVRAVSGGAKKAEQGPPVRRPQPGEPRARGPAAAGGPEGGPARGRPADVFEGASREIRDFMDRLREEAEALEAERRQRVPEPIARDQGLDAPRSGAIKYSQNGGRALKPFPQLGASLVESSWPSERVGDRTVPRGMRLLPASTATFPLV